MTISLGPKLGMLVDGAQGEVHYDQLMRTLRQLDALIQLSVITHSVGTPPGFPSDGDVYIVPPFASDAWSGEDRKVTRWSSKEAAWEFYQPVDGWIAWSVEANGRLSFTNAGGWEPFSTEVAVPPSDPSVFNFVYGGGGLTNSDSTLFKNDSTPGPNTYAVATGQSVDKRYVEFSSSSASPLAGDHVVGLISLGAGLTSLSSGDATSIDLIDPTNIAWASDGTLYIDGAAQTLLSAYSSSDRFGFAVDLDAGLIWLMLNGSPLSGDPTSGTGGFSLFASGDALPFAGLYGPYIDITLHSQAADQLYPPPTGFVAWMA